VRSGGVPRVRKVEIMIEEPTQQAELRAPGVQPMAMCPMATMCKGMMEKPHSGLMAMFPGAVLIVLGLLILIEPWIFVWLVGIAFVLFGVGLLMMGNFLRRLGVHARHM
jgi:hypothetical protein